MATTSQLRRPSPRMPPAISWWRTRGTTSTGPRIGCSSGPHPTAFLGATQSSSTTKGTATSGDRGGTNRRGLPHGVAGQPKRGVLGLRRTRKLEYVVRADDGRRRYVDSGCPIVQSGKRGAVQDPRGLRVPGRRLLRPGRRLGRDEPRDLGRGGRLLALLLWRRLVHAWRLDSPDSLRDRHDFAPSTLASHFRTSSTASGS